MGAAIDRCFQHHLVGWIAKLWAPNEVLLHRFHQRSYRIEKNLELFRVDSCSRHMLDARADRFVFEHQRHIGQQSDCFIKCRAQQNGRSSRWAAQSSHQNVSIEHHSHPGNVTLQVM